MSTGGFSMSPGVSIPMQAYPLDHHSEERAVPINQMAFSSTAGSRQSFRSEQPETGLPDRQATEPGNHGDNTDHVHPEDGCSTSWRRCFSRLSSSLASSVATRKPSGYNQSEVRYDRLEDFEKGIPQLGALIDMDPSFCLFRVFGPDIARLIIQRELELVVLVKKLRQLDKEDMVDEDRRERLHSAEYDESIGSAQKDLYDVLELKWVKYCELVLKYSQIKALGKPTKHDQRSVQRWIKERKPLMEGEADFMQYIDDLASPKTMLESGRPSNQIEAFINSLVANHPHSYITKALEWMMPNQSHTKTSNRNITTYSAEHPAIIASRIVAFIAVLFLLIPVFLLFLVGMSRAAMAGIVLAFVSVFSFTLGAMRVKPQEVLIGSAAYGAFLVTFLGSMNSGPPIVTQ